MRAYLLLGGVVLQGCSADDSTDAVDSGETGAAIAVPAFGAEMEPAYTVVATSAEKLSNPTDLGFHPRRFEKRIATFNFGLAEASNLNNSVCALAQTQI